MKFSSILKNIAKVVGVVCIVYGVIVGIIGAGPDGPVGPVTWRLIALFVLCQGILYFYPNSKMENNLQITTFYIIVTMTPCASLIFYSIITIIRDSYSSFANEGGLLTSIIIIPLSLFAPVSAMISYKKSDQ